jgi:integrase
MASIYRRTRTRADGTKVRDRKHTICFTDEHGSRVTEPGYQDRRSTEAKARQLEERVERLRAGLPVADLEAARLPVGPVVDRWIESLKRQHATVAYVRTCQRVAGLLAEGCGFKSLGSVRKSRFDEWLAGAQGSNDWSDRTVNAHVEVCTTFLRWCVGQGLLPANPLRDSFKVRRPEKRRPKRAFTPGELLSLLAVAPPHRALAYRVAALSGLRHGELRAAQVRDVAPGPPPYWTLRPGVTKARRFDAVPMLPECAEAVLPLLEGRGPGARLLPSRVPRGETFAGDVVAAGLTSPGEDGRHLTFHSLRYTFCTELAKRLPIQRVRQLMRHATIQLTMNLYADLGLVDLWDDSAGLPRILG